MREYINFYICQIEMCISEHVLHVIHYNVNNLVLIGYSIFKCSTYRMCKNLNYLFSGTFLCWKKYIYTELDYFKAIAYSSGLFPQNNRFYFPHVY